MHCSQEPVADEADDEANEEEDSEQDNSETITAMFMLSFRI